MQQGHLFPMVRHSVKNLLNYYIKSEDIINKIDNFIVPPKLGAKSGVLGAIALAQNEGKSYAHQNTLDLLIVVLNSVPSFPYTISDPLMCD